MFICSSDFLSFAFMNVVILVFSSNYFCFKNALEIENKDAMSLRSEFAPSFVDSLHGKVSGRLLDRIKIGGKLLMQ